jgi:hypothetical protein
MRRHRRRESSGRLFGLLLMPMKPRRSMPIEALHVAHDAGVTAGGCPAQGGVQTARDGWNQRQKEQKIFLVYDLFFWRSRRCFEQIARITDESGRVPRLSAPLFVGMLC